MSIRNKIQSSPSSAAAALLLVAIAGGIFAYRLANGSTAHQGCTKAFYSIDDGRTWFAEDAGRTPGFTYEGEPAYRAYVFRAGDGPPFVGYLERLTPEAQSRAAGNRESSGMPGEPRSAGKDYTNAQEIKKPGEARWHRRGTPAAGAVLRIVAPDGSTDPLEPVLP